MRRALEPDTRRLISAVNYSEVLVGPLRRAGSAGAATVDNMFGSLGFETVSVDRALARVAAAVRVRTGLELPDGYALATALVAHGHEGADVRLESFDTRVVKAYTAFEGRPPEVD
jgi:uncharacterized protein with PIN domain